jgi:sulfur-carrier protein adenylyltransferase/sulfurtransferase
MSSERYSRQLILPDFGIQGQQALVQAKVLVIGAGGLGCPVLQYLTAMGVGLLGIVDDDVVSMSNLHRQILYGVDDIGKAKVDVAAQKLAFLNSEIVIKSYKTKLTQANAFDIISDYDVVADCSDNFATRYMVNDACVILKKPMVYAAVSGYEGQLSTFNLSLGGDLFSGNYRDIYPTMPREGEIQNCAEAGILGVLSGILGAMQASEVVKIISGVGQPLCNKLLCYNMKSQQTTSFEFNIVADKICPKNKQEFLEKDYESSCDIEDISVEIDQPTFDAMMKDGNTICVDVRCHDELPMIHQLNHQKIVLSDLSSHFNLLENGNVIFICQSGKRSLEALRMAKAHFNEDRFYSLKGGVLGMPE